MRIAAYPADGAGCGHYRIAWPAEVVARLGHEVSLVPPGYRTGIGGNIMVANPFGESEGDGRLTNVTGPANIDVIVLQRPSNRRLAEAVPHLRARGYAVVVDVDDDLATIHPSNPAWAPLHPRYSPDDNWEHVRYACQQATLVTASTPALAERYGAHGRVMVLPNCVPGTWLDIDHVDEDTEDPLVGWPGSMHSHPDDLQQVGSGVRKAGVRFGVVGPGDGVARALGLRGLDWTAGVVPFPGWGHHVTRLEVGIAPLAETRFNAAKSWLKPLEMAAVGVPWVASPSPEYRRLAEEGCGLLAAKPGDWTYALKRLKDPGLRAEMSVQGREVAARWTYQGNGWRWEEAWERALSMAREGSSVAS